MNARNSRLGLGLIVLALVAGAAFFTRRAGLWGQRPLRVGVILPLSGRDAPAGLGMRNAIRLAVGEANARGGVHGRRVELVELDDGSVPASSLEAARRLVQDPSVVGMLAHYDADSASLTQFELRDGGLGHVLLGISNWDKMRLRSPVEYRILPFGSTQQQHAATYAWDVLGARTYAFVTDDSYFGSTTTLHFREALRARLGDAQVDAEIVVRGNARDFPEVIAKLRAKAPDYVLFAGRAEQAALVLNALRAAGIKSRFQAGIHSPAQEFLDGAKANAEGALAVFHGLPEEETAGGRAFLEAYRAGHFAEPAGAYGLYSYAAAQALVQAMDKSFLSRASVAGALGSERFETALGPLKFNFFGSNYQTVAIYQVANGRWTKVAATDEKSQLKAAR